MKLGVYLNSQHPKGDDPVGRLAETIEQVRLIRSLGFDSIWAGEHHVTPGFHFFPQFALLQRAAPEAEGLWIGTNVALLPLHNPIELAEVGAFMDVMSGGRFLLGVGLGYRPEEYAIYGVPMSERASRLTEGVEIIQRLWNKDRVTHRGRHWQFSETSIAPRPMQSPRPPIIVADKSKRRSSAPQGSATVGWWCRSLPSLSLRRRCRFSSPRDPPRACRPASTFAGYSKWAVRLTKTLPSAA